MHRRDGPPKDVERMPWEMDADEAAAAPEDARDAQTVHVPAASQTVHQAQTEVLPAGPPKAVQTDAPGAPRGPYERRADNASPYPDAPSRGFPPGALALLLVMASAIAGAWLAGTSTKDFAAHLDGQVHALTCSVMPGAQGTLGASGCKEAMLSPFSSVMRDRYWGGVPVALGGLAVFAFLAALAFGQALSKERSTRDTGYLLLAATLPVVTSAYFAWLSSEKVGSFCTVCVGIYAASGATWVFAWIAHLRTPGAFGPLPWGRWLLWTLEGVAFVAMIGWLWTSSAPTERPTMAGCGTLVAEDKAKVLVPLPRAPGARPALMAIDPLCPACRAFDERLKQSGLESRLAIDLLLFPLDSKCNWMVKDSLHPGACALSEAVLCAPGSARQILAWAFQHQPRLLELGKKDDKALRKEVKARFPAVGRCLGSAKAKAKVNKSLRFAVANALQVLTPQLFVDGTRLCDEDTDLGLEYTLGQMLIRGEAGGAAVPHGHAGGRP